MISQLKIISGLKLGAFRVFPGIGLLIGLAACSASPPSKTKNQELTLSVGNVSHFDLTDNNYVPILLQCTNCLTEPICELDGVPLGACRGASEYSHYVEDNVSLRFGPPAGMYLSRLKNGKHIFKANMHQVSGALDVTEVTFWACRRTREIRYSVGENPEVGPEEALVSGYRNYVWNKDMLRYMADFTSAGANGLWFDADDFADQKVTHVETRSALQVFSITNSFGEEIEVRRVKVDGAGRTLMIHYDSKVTEETTAIFDYSTQCEICFGHGYEEYPQVIGYFPGSTWEEPQYFRPWELDRRGYGVSYLPGMKSYRWFRTITYSNLNPKSGYPALLKTREDHLLRSQAIPLRVQTDRYSAADSFEKPIQFTSYRYDCGDDAESY